ncbi:MAG TPA: glycosyltransferase family 4 protein [Gemmatimonadaceae bacterium]|jgi:glycosyltransferase involved in cell wall biosynthesis|nr:glycosyltransferase family 4 protein [Gemmatimonadaceae bacterium]
MPERPEESSPGARPIRVCLVAPSLSILGGQAVAAQRLLARLRAVPGLDVEFLPHDPRTSPLLRLLQRVKYVRTVATSFAYVSSLLRRLPHYDVVHVFSASYWSFLLAPTPAILIGKWLGKKVVVNYRSGEAEDHLQTWPRTSVPTLLRADAVVTPSGYLVDVFSRFGVPAESIANFVDPASVRYRRREALRPVFLSNRNFQALYNVPCVLRAFAIIQRRLPEARLIVIGDGPEREQVHAVARELGLANVKFLGAVQPTEMGRWYDEADVYLNASDIDNMPNSIIEAFACGLPVVTTRAGGIPYVVEHERNGLMVDCGDHEALAASALRLLDEPALAQRVIAEGLSDVKRQYTWDAVGDRWDALYRRLVGAGASEVGARDASRAGTPAVERADASTVAEASLR